VDVMKRSEDLALRRLHKLHRQAMKAALKMKRTKKVKDSVLLARTGQRSVEAMAVTATGLMAWKSSQNWNKHPLTTGRIEGHLGIRETRQSSGRDLPPQSVGTRSLVSRLVEVWERLPQEIRAENNELLVKKRLKVWSENCTQL